MRTRLAGSPETASRRRLAALLAAGGVAVLPTDTLYGLSCAASSAEAIERIRRLKGRRRGAGFILLASDLEMVSTIVARWPAGARETLARIWPAPLTAILPARRGLPAALAPRGAVAVRVPARAGLRRLVAALGEPVVSTSVNRAGRRPIGRIAEIERSFPGLDAYVPQRGRAAARPSTIVDFTVAPPVLARAGRIPWPVRERGKGKGGGRTVSPEIPRSADPGRRRTASRGRSSRARRARDGRRTGAARRRSRSRARSRASRRR